ncbi:MAG: hypothetical protein R2747_13775 [Pyrinomonadaceae bacterium]
MAANRKILITTESSEIFIIRARGKHEIRGFCAGCGGESQMLTLDEAVSLSGIATMEIIAHLRLEKIHFLETAGGHLLICRNSLESAS